MFLEYHEAVGNDKRIPITQGRLHSKAVAAWNELCNKAIVPFGTGCFTSYDANISLLGASQNITRNLQYWVFCKLRYETVLGASRDVI
jgi:hypothetical protein